MQWSADAVPGLPSDSLYSGEVALLPIVTVPVANVLPLLAVVSEKAEYAPKAASPPMTVTSRTDQRAFLVLFIRLVVLGFPREAVGAGGETLRGARRRRLQRRLDLVGHGVVLVPD